MPCQLQGFLRIEQSEKLDQFRHQSCPSRLVTRSEPGAVIPMEVLVQQDMVAPVRVGLEFLGAPVDRPPAALVAQEDAGQPVRDLLGYLEEVHHPAFKAFDPKGQAQIRLEEVREGVSRSTGLGRFRRIRDIVRWADSGHDYEKLFESHLKVEKAALTEDPAVIVEDFIRNHQRQAWQAGDKRCVWLLQTVTRYDIPVHHNTRLWQGDNTARKPRPSISIVNEVQRQAWLAANGGTGTNCEIGSARHEKTIRF
jgi:hypothetical protein